MSFFDMIQSFDTSVLEFIQNTFKCSFLDPIMAFFSYIGEMGLFWIAVGIVFIIFKKTFQKKEEIRNFPVINIYEGRISK